MFATLDTTTRQLHLEGLAGTDAERPKVSASLSDTVGFIRALPHTLVESFKATLQEAIDADLLLHVVDAASPVLAEQRVEVERVLAEIGASEVPQILVFNKFDQLSDAQRPRVLVDSLELDGGRRTPRVFVSAREGTGLPELRALLAAAVLGAALSAPKNVGTATAAAPPSADDPIDA